MKKHPPLINLPPKAASLREPSLAPRRLAEHDVAAPAQHDGLGVAEDGGYVEAAGALHVHEEGVGGRD